MPQLEIPPSPPGSPPPGLDIKLGQFETLRKQGVHFNSKLAASSALKNPSLLPRLLTAAGLDEGLQYANTMANGTSMPTKYPDHAYTESLDAAQEQLTSHGVKEKEARARQFVPAAQ
ncbi:MAG: hypothetical protein OHK93_002401 [Ramalina farinacea]|uniref:Uncharacterized protein n=1 Tax=Ramalina farinacea TaxID=258253 RepID=A0AA43QTB6_9LECA|nr:hypothetical protein [Ramalina farinacea]